MAFPTASGQQPATVVALGGTGVIGRALQSEAARRGHRFLSLSLDPDASRVGVDNLHLDFEAAPAGALTAVLTAALPHGTPILAICNIAGLAPRQIVEIADFAASRTVPLAQVSSCLLYQAPASARVDEATPSLTVGQAAFPYLRLKLTEEAALTARRDVDWRILRTNHVLGPGCLLGCIPGHNRDAALLRRLHAGEPLHLTKAGRVRLSFVHAEDFAAASLDLCADPSTSGQILNLVHPKPVMADDYYRMIAALLGLPAPQITLLSPEEAGFWSLTARDIHFTSHHPAVRKLSFRHDLASALRDTLMPDGSDYAARGGNLQDRLKGH